MPFRLTRRGAPADNGGFYEGATVMTKENRADHQLTATRENAESLLKSAMEELNKLLEGRKADGPKWFPNGIDGVKVSIKLFDVELSVELEGALPAGAEADSDD